MSAEKIIANLKSRSAGGVKALGACIFAGGFSFGMEYAGIQVAGHLELPGLDLGAKVSAQRWPVLVTPFTKWMEFVTRIKRENAFPDVVYANPPCVAYAGTGSHRGTGDERMCYLRYCSYGLAMTLEPTIWVWELVPSIFSKDRAWLDAMAYRASLKGYKTYMFLTTAALHGGFQDRRRFHFIASKVELDFDGVYDGLHYLKKISGVLGDALAFVDDSPVDLENNEDLYDGAFSSLMPFCAPGMHLADVPDSVKYRVYRPRGTAWDGSGGPGFAHVRGVEDKPSPSILGGATIIHPTRDRYLTARECASVMGFPGRYVFSPGMKAYAEIGRGLCTHTAEFIGTVIKAGLIRDKGVVDLDEIVVHDWRKRIGASSIKPSLPEVKAWFLNRHGYLPPEWV